MFTRPTLPARFVTTAVAAGLALAVALLATGCVGASPATTDAAGSTKATAPTNSALPTPDPDPTGTAKPHASYDDTTSGAPVVTRKGLPVHQRATAEPTSFSRPAVYSDKVTIAASHFSRAVITDKGAGIMTGSPYVVFQLKITNNAKETLNLSEVVVTMHYGAGKTAAAPVYDDAKVADFSGRLAPGKSTTGRYAFILPTTTTSAVLYVDTDATRLAAKFTGKIPQ